MIASRPLAGGALCIAMATATLLSGCKVVTLEQDRALRERRSESFDAASFVRQGWESRIRPAIKARAVDLVELDRAFAADFAKAGKEHGRRAGEGSPLTFVVRGEGVVGAIDRHSRAGSLEVQVAGLSASPSVSLQTGPVIVDTALRDSVPFLTFDDFTDQIAYAGVGRALIERALRQAGPTLSSLKPGDRIRFLGAFGLAAPGEPIRIVPLQVSRG